MNNGETRVYLGLFDSDYDAAIAYDTYVAQNREKLGLCHKLNFEHDVDKYFEADSVEIPKEKLKKLKKFDYPNIVKRSGGYISIIRHKGQYYETGLCNSQKDAAKAMDKIVVENKFDKTLNFPEDYPQFVPNYDVKHEMIDIDLTDEKTHHILKTIGNKSCLQDVNPEKDCLLKLPNSVYTIIEKADYDTVKHFTLNMNAYGYVRACFKDKIASLSRKLFENELDEQLKYS